MASTRSPKPVATDSMPDFAGKVLDGRFRLDKCVGLGAYGKVYRATATKPRDGEPALYAVKCLHIPKPGSLEQKLQLREFTNHLAVSQHPNIVSFHQLLRDQHEPFRYVILDFCGGGDLFDAIVTRDFYVNRTDRIKRSFLQLLDAISFCHQNNVYHRDIKPENILVDEDGSHVFIADFGLSTQAPMSRDFGCGSVEYMSPDCISKDFDFKNKSYSTRCNDIWSLGVVLTNMITQRTPWNLARPKDTCFSAFMNDEDYFLRVFAISEGANVILKKIFSIDPLRRISLSDLRREIFALDDFFPPATGANGQISPILSAGNSPRNSAVLRRSYSSALSADISALRLDDWDMPLPATDSFLALPSDRRSLSTLASSLGPVTPETHALYVNTEVPAIGEVEQGDIGLSLLPAKDLVKSGKSVMGKKPFFKRFIYKMRA